MATATLVFTIFYTLVSICFVFPPNEFVSAGFTVEYIFSSWLGSEDLQFVEYHIRRSVATLLAHSLLPLGYVIGLSHYSNNNLLDIFLHGSWVWRLFVLGSHVAPAVVLVLLRVWCRNRWQRHPAAQALAAYSPANGSWTSVAADINMEFRRIDKICITTSAVVKVIATDNWIIKVSPYSMDIAHQSDVVMCLLSSDTHSVSPNYPGGAQFLNIEVKSVRHTPPHTFQIRLNAFDFKDLQDKVLRPIANLQNIAIHRTLSDRFLEAFQEQVEQNAVYHCTEELEPCIGCMQNTSNVKLQKLCGSASTDESCRSCYCRPMWCLYCMGKWFASRQDQNQPETWLAAQCPCPTCRAKFCMLDVCLVHAA